MRQRLDVPFVTARLGRRVAVLRAKLEEFPRGPPPIIVSDTYQRLIPEPCPFGIMSPCGALQLCVQAGLCGEGPVAWSYKLGMADVAIGALTSPQMTTSPLFRQRRPCEPGSLLSGCRGGEVSGRGFYSRHWRRRRCQGRLMPPQ